MVRAVEGMHPATGARAVTVVEAPPETRPVAAREPESALWRKIQAQQFVISVEIDPPKGTSIDRILEQVRKRDGVEKRGRHRHQQRTAGARGHGRAFARRRARGARHRNDPASDDARREFLIGLQAMLLGAWTVGGVRNVLAITGDPPSLGSYPESLGVYEVDSIGLVKVMARLNQGTDWGGKKSWRRNEFHHRRRRESSRRGSGRGIAPISMKRWKPARTSP